MLRFFRQIRQRLLTENRFSKYLLYAVGEILLVVIGILIALQINNWNEDRKYAAALRVALHNVHEEINLNASYLDRQIEYLDSDLEDLEYFIGALNVPDPSMVHDSLITHMVDRLGPFTFTPLRENAYINLIDSGIINYIRDDSLKQDLIGVERGYQVFEEVRANMDENWNASLKPYYIKHAQLIFITDTLHLKPVPETYIKVSRQSFINNLELNNILAVRLFTEKIARSSCENIKRRLVDYNMRIEAYLEKE